GDKIRSQSKPFLYLFQLVAAKDPVHDAAFTFPLVIGATALFKVAHLVEGFAQGSHYVEQIRLLAHFELGVATVIVGYVALRYLMFFLPQRNTEMNNGMARQGAHR
ncbi:hypothetical protein ACK34P_15695, partial [Aeromonas veronii]